MAISPDLYRRIREALLRCGPFDDPSTLRSLFVDDRIAAWRHVIPTSGDARTRVLVVIKELLSQENHRGENVLVLFLNVLGDFAIEGTPCQRELPMLAEELSRELAQRKTTLTSHSGREQVAKPALSTTATGKDNAFRPIWLMIALLVGVIGFWGSNYLLDFNASPTTNPEIAQNETPIPSPTPEPAIPTPTLTPEPLTPTSFPTIEPTPTLGIGSTLVSEKDGMTLVYVPSGNFLMGSREDEPGAEDEKPQHSEHLGAFWIDQTEVTNGMYEQCVQADDCQPPSDISSISRESYYGDTRFVNYPVVRVSWEDAKNCCAWAGRRLPTAVEWEKAARGQDGRIYPWGDDPATVERANYCEQEDCSEPPKGKDTEPVGRYPAGASPYGALDMAGNVWEWVDGIHEDGYTQVPPCSEPKPPEFPPPPPHEFRGGSWRDPATCLRVATRNKDGVPNRNVGFRCALTP
ncbi:MAG: SUMF1/EgtB/PvdO family nonheme iron enzyme [Ardenticatenales bacterium]|nr:SUMF1/EgtB/PvdO family nonheme iron enzyme [Ardenticatenales bacterium]